MAQCIHRFAAARFPDDELGRQGDLCRHFPALQERQQHLDAFLADVIKGLLHGGEDRLGGPAFLGVVEPGDGRGLGYFQSALAHLIHGADRHVVVRAQERVEVGLSFLPQGLESLPPAEIAEVPVDDPIVIHGDVVAAQDLLIRLEPLDCIPVAIRPGHERELFMPMVFDHVGDKIPHTLLVVDEDIVDPFDVRSDVDNRNARVFLQEPIHLLFRDEVANRSLDDQSVDILPARQIVDEIAVFTEDGSARAFEEPSSKTDDVLAVLPARLHHGGEQIRRIGSVEVAEEEPDGVSAIADGRIYLFRKPGRSMWFDWTTH